MGIHLQSNPQLVRLMSPEDQARYAYGPNGKIPYSNLTEEFYAKHPEYAPVVPPPKTDKLEREEQRHFANQLLLWNSQGRKIPWIWHSTAHRSKATPGTPDFLVGIAGKWLSIEFKRDYSCRLSDDQVEFCEACLAQKLEYHIVYSADAAIKLVEEADTLA